MSVATQRYGKHIDLQGNRLYNAGTLLPTALAGTVLDFADAVDNVQTVAVAALTTFTTANLAAGRSKEVLITGTVAATLNFPATWIWYGSKLTASVLSKEIRLTLKAYGTTDATVRAQFVAQV